MTVEGDVEIAQYKCYYIEWQLEWREQGLPWISLDNNMSDIE